MIETTKLELETLRWIIRDIESRAQYQEQQTELWESWGKDYAAELSRAQAKQLRFLVAAYKIKLKELAI